MSTPVDDYELGAAFLYALLPHTPFTEEELREAIGERPDVVERVGETARPFLEDVAQQLTIVVEMWTALPEDVRAALLAAEENGA